MMKATVIALLCSPKFVYAFASVKAANPPYNTSLNLCPLSVYPYVEWYQSSNACSKPDFFPGNWKVYNNTKPLCKLHPFQFQTCSDTNARFFGMNSVALYPHREISKRDPAEYVALQKDLKTDIIEDYVLQNRVLEDAPAHLKYNYPEDATLPKLLAQDNTDGIIIMHQGKVVYEKYTAPFNSYTRHKIYSNTKSFVGLMVQMLINADLLSEDDQLTDIVPELKGSGFEGATVGNALNMRVAVAYTEDPFFNRSCDLLDLSHQLKIYSSSSSSTFPVVPGCEMYQMMDASITQVHSSYWQDWYGVRYNPGPQNLREFIPLLQKRKDQEHGIWYGFAEGANYKSIITDVLAWVLDKILANYESSAEEYFEEHLWSKVGQGHDAMLQLGNAQIPWWQAGLSATLGDMARVGDMLLHGGKNKHGVQVVPEAVLAKLRRPPADFLPEKEHKCNQGYLDQFWIGQNQAGDAYADKTWFGMVGIWGQYNWIYPHLNMTVVRQSTDRDWKRKQCVHDAAFQELGVRLGQIAGSGK